MTLIKCKECKKEISSSAKTCPHCGYKNEVITCPECGTAVKTTDDVCSECGYPLQKKNPQNIINENLDKITGAKSKSYVTFKDLFKDTFKKHSEEEIDDLFVCGGNKTTPDLKDVDPKKATAWVYFKILVFFIIAYIPTRIGYLQYGNLNFLPAMIMLGAFAVPITVLIFFYEINILCNSIIRIIIHLIMKNRNTILINYIINELFLFRTIQAKQLYITIFNIKKTISNSPQKILNTNTI